MTLSSLSPVSTSRINKHSSLPFPASVWSSFIPPSSGASPPAPSLSLHSLELQPQSLLSVFWKLSFFRESFFWKSSSGWELLLQPPLVSLLSVPAGSCGPPLFLTAASGGFSPEHHILQHCPPELPASSTHSHLRSTPGSPFTDQSFLWWLTWSQQLSNEPCRSFIPSCNPIFSLVGSSRWVLNPSWISFCKTNICIFLFELF